MLKWKAAVVALSLGLLTALVGLVEQQRARAATQAPSLEALDYIQIQQLANRYGQAIDTCSNNG
jgi:hypothetical protein